MSGAADSVVIIGAGLAGAMAASHLRQHGYAGDVTLVGSEDHLPYHRPPLSKEWLTSDMAAQQLRIRPPKFYEDRKIQLRLGAQVVEIDRARHLVQLADGAQLKYGRLVYALGSRPLRLGIAGADLDGVLYLRTQECAGAIKAALLTSRRLVVIGAGFIGLEVAATARTLGLEVTVLEKADRVLARVSSPELSKFIEQYHRDQGVRIELACGVASIHDEGGRVAGVQLADGRLLRSDHVVVGVGAVANDDLARSAGLECARSGILVDALCRTSDPFIHAAGDCAVRRASGADSPVRLESVQNANEQAKRIAAHLCAKPRPIAEVPWFWSDQYGLRVQTAGLLTGAERPVVRGSPHEASFSILHLRPDHSVTAVEAVNDPKGYLAARAAIASGAPVQVASLSSFPQTVESLTSHPELH